MNTYRLTLIDLVVLLALLLYTATLLYAGQVRQKSGVKSPATTGDLTLERALRVQQNTLEQLVVFIPAIYLCAIFVSVLLAEIGGVLWLAGRVIYWRSYMRDPDARTLGFTTAFVPQTILVVAALIGALWTLLRGL